MSADICSLILLPDRDDAAILPLSSVDAVLAQHRGESNAGIELDAAC